MGHSEYDPAFAERRPWNAARKPGAKRAFKPQQVWAIRFYLDRERRLRDRALFESRAGLTTPNTSAPDNMPGLSTSGSLALACGERTTVHTHFAEPRHRSSTRQPAICALYRSSSDIQRSRAPFDTSGSMSKTRSPWLKALRCSGLQPAPLAFTARSWHPRKSCAHSRRSRCLMLRPKPDVRSVSQVRLLGALSNYLPPQAPGDCDPS
jgi:hypothetical protein